MNLKACDPGPDEPRPSHEVFFIKSMQNARWNRAWLGLGGQESLALWLGWILGLSFLFSAGVLAVSSNRLVQGLDEASHVLTSANPWASPAWGIFFGYFLHPLWELGQGSLLGFRLAGFIALTATTLIFVFFFAGFLRRTGIGKPLGPWIPAIGASLLILAFSRYVVGMRTPNYDWVVLVGGLFFAAGWLAIETRTRPGFPFLGEALCAGGLTTVLMGKWTALPGYALLLVWLLLWRKGPAQRSRRVAALCGWGLVFAALFIGYVTPEGIAAVVRAGWIQVTIHSHDGAWSRLPWDLLKFSWTLLRALPYVAGLYGLIWAVLYFSRGRSKPEPQLVNGLTFLLGLPLVALRGHFTGGGEYFAKGVMVTAVWFLGVWFMTRSCRENSPEPANAAFSRVFWMLMALPWIHGLGTATSMVDYLGYGLVFPAAAAWMMLLRATSGGLPSGCVAAAFLTLGVTHAARVATSTFHVHRLGSAWAETRWIESGPEKGKFRHYPSAVAALAEISQVMEKNGYRLGDPVLGLTDLPGLVYFLGGVSPGVSWYMSYRMGESFDGVRRNLENIPPKTLEKCWVVFRAKNKKSEALDLIWPSQTGIPLPEAIGAVLVWPWEPREKQLEPVTVYRPARLGGDGL